MMVTLKGAVLKRIEISLLETGRQPKTALPCLYELETNIGSVIHHITRAKFSLAEPIPLQAVYADHSQGGAMDR